MKDLTIPVIIILGIIVIAIMFNAYLWTSQVSELKKRVYACENPIRTIVEHASDPAATDLSTLRKIYPSLYADPERFLIFAPHANFDGALIGVSDVRPKNWPKGKRWPPKYEYEK